ncbi:MAG: nucleoside triphosphate pyrophosphohydrolase [Parasphingorhabdus sp.]
MVDPLLKIMRQLRDPETGCEWDKVQTFQSIAPYTIEESYEVSDAIERNDMDGLKDELGDLLLQVVFHSQIATDEGHFEFNDVVASICAKMERRHPHIFGDDDQNPEWEELKASERNEKGDRSALDGVAIALPALLRAQKIQKRAARVGFDWPDVKQVMDKVHEELAEVEEASTPEDIEEEIGDLLFATVNLARHHGIEAENALKEATKKFGNRFRSVEDQAGKDLIQLPLEQLEKYWQRAKENEKSA